MIHPFPSGTLEMWRTTLDGVIDPEATPLKRPLPNEALSHPLIDFRVLDATRRAFLKMVPRLPPSGILAVVSPNRREGRSTVAAALALGIARDTHASVLLMELDAGRPGQARLFDIAPTPGLAECVLEGADFRAVSGLPGQRLWVVPAGAASQSASLIYRLRSGELFTACRERFTWVVLDLPPVADNPEAAALASDADGYLLLGRYRKTTVRSLEQTAELVGSGQPSGFLLTGDRSRIPGWIRRLL